MTILKKIRKAVYNANKENEVKVKYPKAKIIPDLPLMARGGTYKNKFPEGIIVHFTAGWRNQKPRDAIAFANSMGHRYFFIAENGDVYQQFDLSGYGAHAGVSTCPVTKRTTVAQYYVGIEVACGGCLEDADKDGQVDDTYFKYNVNPKDIRSGAYLGANQYCEGNYEKFTEAQEASLVDLCVWLCKNGVNPNLILGHDEITIQKRSSLGVVTSARKNDPGLSLSMSMDNFRKLVKSKLDEGVAP